MTLHQDRDGEPVMPQEDNWRNRKPLVGDPETAVDRDAEVPTRPVPRRGEDKPPPPGARRIEVPR